METADLVGKFLLMYTQGVDLHHPTSMSIDRVEEISGKIFLIGKQPSDLLGRENWLGNIETFLAWDSVTQFHVFNDYKAFKEVCADGKLSLIHI